MKKRIAILCRNQFGYHTDTYAYCRYLPPTYHVTYVGWDYGFPRMVCGRAVVHYVSRAGGVLSRYIRFLACAIRVAKRTNGICFLKYFPGCMLLRLLAPGNIYVLDVRTGAVGGVWVSRALANMLLRFETLFFRNITVVSLCLSKQLRLPARRVHILPLGADKQDIRAKSFEKLNLLYVGTLENRRIEDTIEGLARFCRSSEGGIDIRYTIVGSGPHGEEGQLREAVLSHGLEHMVSIEGARPPTEIRSYLARHNIGVSYVPVTTYFDCQPPTKTFEYMLAGLAVLATRTAANAEVVDERNGVLAKDTPSGFARALEEIVRRRRSYDSERIRDSCSGYEWQKIVAERLVPYLEQLSR